MKKINYNPQGVCSREIVISIDDNDVVSDIEFVGGCPGNTMGVSKLAIGKSSNEVVSLLKGITCGNKSTSCPDQLAIAIEKNK